MVDTEHAGHFPVPAPALSPGVHRRPFERTHRHVIRHDAVNDREQNRMLRKVDKRIVLVG